MHHIKCAEIWGGIKNVNTDACSSGLTASLFSSACEGGKGGDIYYIGVCGQDKLTRIAIADVVGHGSTASEVSQWLYDILKDRMNDPSNDELLSALNTVAIERGLLAMTTASVIGYYSDDTHGRFAYAGHFPALLKKKNASAWADVNVRDSIGLSNLPLGVDADTTFAQEEVQLCHGDRLFLYTDGVVEAPDGESVQFGRDRLLDVLHEAGDVSLHELKIKVLDAIRTHTGGILTHDDVTILIVEVS